MKKSGSFYQLETIGGILLFIAALMAIVVANSPLRFAYTNFLHITADISIGDFIIKKTVLLWVNDGLMAVYFLLVGLEIKREITRGILSNKTSIIVPAVTALCGLVVPALIFSYFNYENPTHLKGWAIPTATDIAFTLGIIALLGSRVPFALKILLTAIAIFDDLGAIVIIAIFYTKKLSLISLSFALLFTATLFLLNIFKCKRISIFVVVGIALWAAVLKSGVHATLSGIILAMAIPDNPQNSLLTKLENGIHPWVVFLILPLFAFANAGVTFIGFTLPMFIHPVVLGVSLGLFIGKQIGIFIPLAYFVKYKRFLASANVTYKQVYGIALICGVGFTMSLFIGSLAYEHDNGILLGLVKLGVLLGSTVSGLLGYLILKYVSKTRKITINP